MRPDRSSLDFYRQRLRQPVRDLDRNILRSIDHVLQSDYCVVVRSNQIYLNESHLRWEVERVVADFGKQPGRDLPSALIVAEQAAAIGLVEGFIGPAKSLIGHLRDSLGDAWQSPRAARVSFWSAIDQDLALAVVRFAQNREILVVSLSIGVARFGPILVLA